MAVLTLKDRDSLLEESEDIPGRFKLSLGEDGRMQGRRSRAQISRARGLARGSR